MRTIKPQPWSSQLFDLTLMQLTNWRWSWRSMLITGTLAPLASLMALGTFSRHLGIETLSYILAGNLVMALMFENQGKVCSNFAFMQAMGMLNYFATLPLRRHLLILATVLSFLMLSLPSLAITLLLGSLFLQVPLHLHPLLLVVIPLAALPMAGIGALIGLSARSAEEAGSISLLVTFAAVAIGPVVIPPTRLPVWMNQLGNLSPATYAASALRQTLLGPVTERIILDFCVLIAFTALTFWLVGRKMEWRVG
ncbi:MAG TPA: ABC transporter permease [Anaerolineales bacterium]|nr:ABC transporter permease [Anaerolineales bacterium]